jgi:hypothetical protein
MKARLTPKQWVGFYQKRWGNRKFWAFFFGWFNPANMPSAGRGIHRILA